MNNFKANLVNASPYIFYGIGVVSVVGTIATAIHATMKLEPILDDHNEAIEEIKAIDISEVEDKDEALAIAKSQESSIRKQFAKTTGRIALLYAPTALFAGLAIGSFTASVGIFRKRYVGALGALEATSLAFDRYRAHVREDYGEEVDNMYYYDLKKEQITEEETDPETGKKKKVKKDILVGEPNGQFTYRFERYQPNYDLGFTQWDETPSFSQVYISGIIGTHQAKLDKGDKVWLLDILKDLGAGSAVLRPEDHFAGYLPGDIIDCGLFFENARMFDDTMRYLRGESPDVTLRFNARPNIFTEAYGKNVAIETTKEVNGDDK